MAFVLRKLAERRMHMLTKFQQIAEENERRAITAIHQALIAREQMAIAAKAAEDCAKRK
ncbi:MAG TPA: hypothetical protein VFE50_20500 [Cyclobacteriaceae bacterium]|nr:hypothetical protein [Cyclobacteriaceae bacterium]